MICGLKSRENYRSGHNLKVSYSDSSIEFNFGLTMRVHLRAHQSSKLKTFSFLHSRRFREQLEVYCFG